jgi:hypothetical protein
MSSSLNNMMELNDSDASCFGVEPQPQLAQRWLAKSTKPCLRSTAMKSDFAIAINGTIQEFWRWQLWFPLFVVGIAAVSLYDAYLIVRFRDMIWMMEENPMGQWLLNIADGQVGIFVRVKLAGTVMVLSLLMLMWKMRMSMLFPVTTTIASWQTGLMIYLTAF